MPTEPAGLLPGAQPFSGGDGAHGALVLHGFTGTPHSIRDLATSLAQSGLVVEAPLLPGHGTSMDDMLGTVWDDWYGAVEQAHLDLAARVDRVVLVGLSMGGTLCVMLAVNHPEVAGVAAINPYIDPPAESFRDILRGLRQEGIEVIPSEGGSDIADPAAKGASYAGTPVAPLLSLCEALDGLAARLPEVTCPLLVLTSRQDHVVPPVSSGVLADAVAGPVERVWLEDSFHVATLDLERADVERRVLEFAAKVTTS